MSTPIAYGLDFGTSNSSVSVAFDDGTVGMVPIDPDGTMPHSLPSIAYLHRNGNRAAGQDAAEEFLITGTMRTQCRRCSLVVPDIEGFYSECKQYRHGGSCHDSRLVGGLKNELANDVFVGTSSWAVDFEPEDLTSVILSDLKRRADRFTGRDIRRVVLGHPVVFAGAEGDHFERLQGLAVDRIAGAAERAGFDEIEVYPEPAAVFLEQHLPDGYSVAVDFGGGTFDVAVLRVGDGDPEIVALQGAAVGGELFDGIVFDQRIAGAIGLHQVAKFEGKEHFLPAWLTTRMRTLAGVKHLLSNRDLIPTLDAFRAAGGDVTAIDEILHGGQAFRFYRAIEDAKIGLSQHARTRIDFRRPDLSVSTTLDRDDFERWIAGHLEVAEQQILLALEQAGIEGSAVRVVLRTGGSSQIPAFVRGLERIFPGAEIRERPAFTTVAQGLGIYASEVWGT